ncbi:MAG: choice-of-anchor Q domain-containing protein [Saprospiraceae bacterium]
MRKLYFFIAAVFLSLPDLNSQQTHFVNQAAMSGLQNGTSWSDAFLDLQSALNAAGYGHQIWVAKGTYFPTTSANRSMSFELKNGVKLIGGFTGTEISADQRDPALNPTRLSGNIGDTAIQTDNSYHVLRGKGLDDNTLLDGFIISDGFSVGAVDASSDPNGAGLYLVGSSLLANSRPTIANCLFENNQAGEAGGAIFASFHDLDDPFMSENLVNPVFFNCVFDQNQAKFYGGAIMKEGPTGVNDSFLIEDCKFTQNYVYYLDGGGIYFARSNQSKIQMSRCLFDSNTAFGGQGGGFCLPTYEPGGYTTDLILDSCTFRKNIAPIGGGFYYDGQSSDHPDVILNLSMWDCLFYENTSKNDLGSAFAAAISNNEKVNAELLKCQFINNKARGYFTAAFLSYGQSEINVLLERCAFIGNIDIENPTAYCAAFDAGGNKANTRINNCLFAHNGSAIFAGSGEQSQVVTEVTNCTFYRNGSRPFGKRWYPSFSQPGAVYYNKMFINNCVIWEPDAPTYLLDNNHPIIAGYWFFINYCTIQPMNEFSMFNFVQALGDSTFIGVYPDFVDTTGYDFRLKACSPAMDRGNNEATTNAGLLTDLDGLSRIRFERVDIGAYETQDSCFTISSEEPFPASISARIVPNPARPGSFLDIHVPGFEQDEIAWVMRDAYGRSVSSGSASLGEKQGFSVVAPGSAGIYLLEMRSKNQAVWLKFVVR